MRSTGVILVIPIIAAILLGCGGATGGDQTVSGSGAGALDVSANDPTASSSEASPASAPPRGPQLKLVSSDYGRILANGRGRAVYLFTADSRRHSNCYGACARAWPPYLVKRAPVAGKRVRAKLLGTTRRSDGRRQVTYAGHPLYYYVGDSPGRVLCQDVEEYGGHWYVVRRTGHAVR
jgi:predicted lipoprotein with Yx(FWY)xxD motif